MSEITVKPYLKFTILTFIFLLTTACATVEKKPVTKKSNLITTSDVVAKCQLQGKIKRLGTNFSYLARGQIIQTSYSTCNIRGGKIISEI